MIIDDFIDYKMKFVFALSEDEIQKVFAAKLDSTLFMEYIQYDNISVFLIDNFLMDLLEKWLDFKTNNNLSDEDINNLKDLIMIKYDI